MNAEEARKLTEEARIVNSHAYLTVLKIIKARATNGENFIDLPISSVPINVFKKLQSEGYSCKYTFKDCIIEW